MNEKAETKPETSDRVRLERVVRPRWMKITRRTKPPEGEPVWLWDGERMWIGAYEYCDDDPGGWFYGMGSGLYWDGTKNVLDCNEWDDEYKPTHFMILPEPPAA